MENKSSEYDLTEGQKSRLFGLGLAKPQDKGIDMDEQKTDMLYDILCSRLPVESSVVDSLPGAVKDLCPSLNSIAGETIGDLLQNPRTEMSTLKRIKRYAKESGTSAESEAQSEVYLLIYNAAIASALTFHGKKITQHPYEDLQGFFLSYIQEIWVLEDIKDLFHKAQMHCKRIIESDSA